ncbi:MAG: 3-isopropylmalate dehydrogenase [Rhodospirillaceae bacterium]|nr:3-isopropylmalate dehydrogenase [Rhodospirillaceae bacterium]
MLPAKKILILPGDGIGPEVMAATRRVMDWFQSAGRIAFETTEGLIGGASYEVHRTPITDATIAAAQASDAVLFACIGGPTWDQLPYDLRPEKGLLRLRKEMGLFANLRPAIVMDALAGASSLKLDLVRGLDIMIVRELIGGVYFGEPRGVEQLPDGTRRGYNTQAYSTAEILRVARVAFELARKRAKRVMSVDKANVMESGLVWREEVTKLRDAEYPDVALAHMYVDNCSMQLVRAPKQFDVILTDNLFGDILSDLASMLTGSLGMLPSASLGAARSGEAGAGGRQPALYEPVHGSAPDIAGKGIANPLAMILSFAMMLRYSFNLGADADLLERAVQNVLSAGVRTGDIAEPGQTPVGTLNMADAVVKELGALAAKR